MVEGEAMKREKLQALKMWLCTEGDAKFGQEGNCCACGAPLYHGADVVSLFCHRTRMARLREQVDEAQDDVRHVAACLAEALIAKESATTRAEKAERQMCDLIEAGQFVIDIDEREGYCEDDDHETCDYCQQMRRLAEVFAKAKQVEGGES